MQRHIYRTSLYLALFTSILTTAFYLLVFLYHHNEVSNAGDQVDSSIQMMNYIKNLGFNFVMFFVFSFVLSVLNLKIITSEIVPKIRTFLLFVSTIAAVLSLSYLFSYIKFLCGIDKHLFYFFNIIRDLTIAFILSLCTHLLYISRKQQQTALENRTLIAENMRTRYEALKNQVDPHFLFNSLNTLNALVKIDADKAQQYVQQLSYVFRYTLQNKEIISLEEELDFTRAYCHLMQIRYGDSLQIVYQIDPRFHKCSIIPLSLQTLVENAIKHNVVSLKQPLTISFVTDKQGTIRVSNPIQLKKELESGEGIGLTNLSARYRLMWQQEIVVTRNDGIFSVEIVLNDPL